MWFRGTFNTQARTPWLCQPCPPCRATRGQRAERLGGSRCAQVFVGETESPDSVVRRFRKQVMQAGVIQECRRRRYFETPQDIVKRKQQAARRKKGRRFTPRDGPAGEGKPGEGAGATGKKAKGNDDDDFWGGADELDY
eukprot:SM000162S02385  [mRNA]  locus=s162:283592:284470:+ [translate_table: standard]